MSELPKSPLEIPSVLEAIVQERLIRDAAYLPVNESIYGIEVKPLTLFHLNILRIMRSPLLSSTRLPTPEEMFGFLWVISPKYRPDARWKRFWFIRRLASKFLQSEPGYFTNRFPFLKRRWKQRTERGLVKIGFLINDARKYMDESFQDRPPSKVCAGYQADYYSDSCSMCALFAREFGWSEESVLHMPIKRVFQYQNEIRQRNNPNAILFNPSDRKIMDFMAAENEKSRNN